jgi:hypothetical protein
MRKAIGFEPLHTTTFVIHTNQQVLTDFLDFPAQAAELRTVLPISGKQNQASYQRMLEPSPVGLGQGKAGNINDQGRVKSHGGSRVECD